MYLMPLKLKTANMVNFTLYAFYHNFFKKRKKKEKQIGDEVECNFPGNFFFR